MGIARDGRGSGDSPGGWVPKGRQAEDGKIPENYELQEMPTDSHRARTEQNVISSDGTAIISHGKLSKKSGSGYTVKMAKKYKRPWLHLDMGRLNVNEAARTLRSWIEGHRIEVLHVAGRACRVTQGYTKPRLRSSRPHSRKIAQALTELTCIQGPVRR